MKYVPFLFLIFSLTSCNSLPFSDSGKPGKQPQATTANVKTTSTSNKVSAVTSQTLYLIQPGDLIEIDVWKEKDLKKEVLVRPDGILTFPLVGDINAAGLTFMEFQKALTKKLSRYVPRPVVTVSVKKAYGNKIFVLGKVNRPGEYPNDRNLDVMQALSLAGGLNSFASQSSIKILRRVNGKSVAFSFNYKKVKKGKDLEQNIMLKSGDTIVVR